MREFEIQRFRLTGISLLIGKGTTLPIKQVAAPKIAVLVGAGMVAKTHIAAFADMAEKVRLKAILSRGSARANALAKEAAREFGLHPEVVTDLEAVASDPEVDFVVIVTPPDVRGELIHPLAAAGKHILLEKPMGRTTAEAREVLEICRGAEVSLGVVFQHRMRACSRRAAQLVASGEPGALGLAEIAVPWWRQQSYYDETGRGSYARDGGGVLISQAIHTVDLALSLTGSVASVRAMAATTRFHDMEAEDFVVAGLKFTNGAVGSIVASTASFPGGAESINLHFERASLRLASNRLTVIWRDGREDTFGEESGTGAGADPMAFSHEWHRSIIEDFVDALASGRPPAVPGEVALGAHDLVDAMIRSARSGKEEMLTV